MQTVTTDKTQTTTETAFASTATLLSRMHGEKALEIIMPFLDDIQADQVRKLIVSPQILVGVGLSYSSLYAQDRDLFLKAFNKDVYDVASLDNIGDRAMGFWQADIRYRQALEEQGPLAALIEQAKALRAKLLRAAAYLWEDDPKLGQTVAEIRANQSYMDKADDLARLSVLFSDHWQEAEGVCNVTEEDVLLASDLGAKVLEIIGSGGSSDIAEAKETRNLSAEYLRRGIEDIFAIAAFEFRNDPESLSRYPKLYGSKKKPGAKENGEETAEETTDEATAATVPTPQTDQAASQNQPPAA
jgi:hypothetical protein